MRVNFTPFISKSFQIWDHFFPLLSPKDLESLKILDIWLQEVGEKRRLNGTSKVNTQTDTWTDISTQRANALKNFGLGNLILQYSL